MASAGNHFVIKRPIWVTTSNVNIRGQTSVNVHEQNLSLSILIECWRSLGGWIKRKAMYISSCAAHYISTWFDAFSEAHLYHQIDAMRVTASVTLIFVIERLTICWNETLFWNHFFLQYNRISSTTNTTIALCYTLTFSPWWPVSLILLGCCLMSVIVIHPVL